MSLTWNGPEVERKAAAAAAFGIDQTMALCVVLAKGQLYPQHGWVSGALQGSIEMRPAVNQGGNIVGFWGSFLINYARWIEQGGGVFTGYNYLRSSADHEYPKLAGRIAKRFAA